VGRAPLGVARRGRTYAGANPDGFCLITSVTLVPAAIAQQPRGSARPDLSVAARAAGYTVYRQGAVAIDGGGVSRPSPDSILALGSWAPAAAPPGMTATTRTRGRGQCLARWGTTVLHFRCSASPDSIRTSVVGPATCGLRDRLANHRPRRSSWQSSWDRVYGSDRASRSSCRPRFQAKRSQTHSGVQVRFSWA